MLGCYQFVGSTHRRKSLCETIIFTLAIATVGYYALQWADWWTVSHVPMLPLLAAMQLVAGARMGPIRGLFASVVGASLAAIPFRGADFLGIFVDPVFAGSAVNALLFPLMLKLLQVNVPVDRTEEERESLFFKLNALMAAILIGVTIPAFSGNAGWFYRMLTLVLFLISLVFFLSRITLGQQRGSFLFALLISCLMSSVMRSTRIIRGMGWVELFDVAIPWFLWEAIYSVFGLQLLSIMGRTDTKHVSESERVAEPRSAYDRTSHPVSQNLPRTSAGVGENHDYPSHRRFLFFLNKDEFLILAGLCVLLGFALWHFKSYQISPAWDGPFYISYSISSTEPPVYPFFIMVLRIFISDGLLAARVVSMFFLCATMIVVYFLSKKYASPALALGAALFAGFAPLSLRMGIDTLSEATYTFFIVLAAYLYSLSLGKKSRSKKLFWVGMVSGIAFFTRPEAAVFFTSLLLLDIYKTRTFKGVIAAVGGFATVLVPMVLGIFFATGEFVLTRKTVDLQIMSPYSWIANDKKFIGHPAEMPSIPILLKSMISNYGFNFRQEATNLVIFAGVPALTLAIWYLVKQKSFLIAGLMEFFVFPLFTGLGMPQRFVFPYLPLIGVLGIAAISRFIPERLKIVAVVALMAGTLAGYSFLITPLDNLPEQKEAGYAMRRYVNQNSIVLDRKPYAAFYAGVSMTDHFLMIPYTSMDSVIQYAHQSKANFLVLDRRVIHVFRPELMTMFDPKARQKYSNSVQLLIDLHPDSGSEVLVFRVLQ